MPPKHTHAQKLTLVLTYLQGTGTCHSLKDLEKTLPAVASINGIQVKEFIQSLVDDGKLRVEKIGSGNWYWSFPADELNEKTKVLEGLRADVAKIECTVQELEGRVEECRMKMVDEDDGEERDEVIEKLRVLEEAVGNLRAEEKRYAEAGVGHVEKMKGNVEEWKVEAEMWTGDMYILERWMLENMLGDDRAGLEDVKRLVYGGVPGEWTEEGGLREL